MNGVDCAARFRCVVTGLGATTPLGGDVPSLWRALLRGESGIRLLSEESWTALMPTTLGARVRVEPVAMIEPIQWRRLGRNAQLAVTAANEAWRDAGLGRTVAAERVGVAISATMGDVSVIVDSWEKLKDRGWKRILPMSLSMTMANSAAVAVSILIGAQAGVYTTVNACSSGTQALATGLDMIRRGLADVVLAGGTEAPLHPLVLSGFAAMRALSQRSDDPAAASRPFDVGRDGLVLGEGAGVLILESRDHALRRGARIYAELTGVGISSDGTHMVQPEPNGTGSAAAMRAALADAGVAPADVVHINANGTASLIGDTAEARAIRTVFGDATQGPPLTANKSMLGHSLGAAGAVESIVTVLSAYHTLVPPTRNFTRHDDDLSVDVVHGAPRPLTGEQVVVMKNSAGFGGHNVALVFRATPDREASAPVPA